MFSTTDKIPYLSDGTRNKMRNYANKKSKVILSFAFYKKAISSGVHINFHVKIFSCGIRFANGSPLFSSHKSDCFRHDSCILTQALYGMVRNLFFTLAIHVFD